MKALKIIYEDKDIVAVDKPAGLMTHADGRSKEKTLADMLVKKYPEMKDVGEPIELADGSKVEKPGIVHRLDKETSGVILAARNQEAFLYLKNLFQEREMKKTYQAIIWGNLKDDRGVVNQSIARSPIDFRRWSAGRGKRGQEREAITEYKVLKRFKAPVSEKDEPEQSFTWIEVKPKTGRTHQIRVHMKFLQHPVVCDKLYAPDKVCPVLGMDRLALHASSIEFDLPDGKHIKIESPLAPDFKKAVSID